MQIVFELAPVIGTIISAHCPGTGASEEFLSACVHGHWNEATAMVEGMLAEPWHLQGYQENRLREFLEPVQVREGIAAQELRAPQPEPGLGNVYARNPGPAQYISRRQEVTHDQRVANLGAHASEGIEW